MNARADTTIAMSEVLGIGELLNVPNMKPEFKAQAARNALVPVLSGIAAIGDWMTQDAAHEDLQSETMSNTGYLLTFLANLASDLQHIGAGAQYDLRTRNAKSKEGCL
ncbi:hypothetical protein [Rhodanobacter geophilus]|uniref:DUF3077 domain-containing protein n=1 Tax=Rhodanobacter geophilus TaxID=3162488 RepID=A0ABV3QLZ9_9GAMM